MSPEILPINAQILPKHDYLQETKYMNTKPGRHFMTSFAHSKVSRAILMTVAMILASFAGCLGGETVPVEDIVEDIDDTIDNGTTNATDGGTNNTTDGGDVTVGIIVLFDSTGVAEALSAQISNCDQCYLAWDKDGMLVGNLATVNLTNLSAGNHTYTLTVIDNAGMSHSASTVISIPSANHIPTINLVMTTDGYSGDAISWVIESHDADGDTLALSIDYGDGESDSSANYGSHSWTSVGNYTITATADDGNGGVATFTHLLIIVEEPDPIPTLVASHSHLTDGRPTILVSDEFTITYNHADYDDSWAGGVDWGDGSTETIFEGTATHTYSTAGRYDVKVMVTNSDSDMRQKTFRIEVIAELDDSEAYELMDDFLSDSHSAASDLDADEDGNIDQAEPAVGEEGLDVEDTFEVNAAGEPNHDEGNIDVWQEKDTGQVSGVAASNDTAGGARAAESDDVLRNESGRVADNETEVDNPIDGIEDNGAIHEELFNMSEMGLEELEDSEVVDGDTYEALATSSSGAITFTETFTLDIDTNDDGVDDAVADCTATSYVWWVDSDGDSNPERAVMFRGTQCVYNPDGGAAEVTGTLIEGLNYTDINSNGHPEIVMALRILVIEFSNNSHTVSDKNTNIEVFAVVDLDEDGNNEYVLMAAAEGREIDHGKDGVLEVEAFEVGYVYLEDVNDDGTPEKSVLLKLAEGKWDLDGDGNVNSHSAVIQIVYIEDVDMDGNQDRLRAAQFGGHEWDNNSDGTVDSKQWMFLGYGLRDRNNDGTVDRVTMAVGAEDIVDSDGDGNPEQVTSFFYASQIDDWNADGNFNKAWQLAAVSEKVDSDSDGHWESVSTAVAGAEAVDWDDDGIVDRFTAVRFFEMKGNQGASGNFQESTTVFWLIEITDWNSDGVANSIHAVVGMETGYDNNSDGQLDTYSKMYRGWFGRDANQDGHAERQVFIAYNGMQNDDDADGNLEVKVDTYVIHVKHSSPSGLSHEWFYLSRQVQFNVSSAGHAQSGNATVVAYETWNDSTTQETHAYVAHHEFYDSDRDGNNEYSEFQEYDNRQGSPP